MNDIEKELPEVMNRLLHADLASKRKIVERYFTKDCRITHALVMGENREDIIRIYQFWKFTCTRNSAQVHEIIVDKDATKASVQFTQVVENYMHGPSFDLVMNIIFYFEDAPHGKVICKQVDYHSFESVFVTKPIFNWLHAIQRKANTLLIVGTPSLVAKVWPQVEATARRLPILDKNWEYVGNVLSGWWWKDHHDYRGVAMAPYDPHL